MSRAGWLWHVAAGAACWSIIVLASPVGAGGGGEVIAATRKASVPSAPSALLGQWEVTRVLLDLADQPHWGMIRPGDPSLLYRGMTIAADKIWFVGSQKSCDQTGWQPLATTWQGLFQTTGISRAPSNSAPTRAKPEDYDLKVSGKQRVQAFPVCARAARGAAKSWRDAGWMALEGEQLVVRYSGQVIVVLRKRATDEKPQASFPCDKAGSATEQAICSDLTLAAWDRSVAEALRQVLERRTEREDRERIMKTQVAWKTQRNKCAADPVCIRDALDERVTELIQE